MAGLAAATAATLAVAIGCSRPPGQDASRDTVGSVPGDTVQSNPAGPAARAAGAAGASVATARTATRPVVLFAGTSLTAGLGLDPDSAYPMLIQRKIDSAGLPFAVTNAGVSGETTSGLMSRLDWLLRGNFDVVVLETGANDGLRGIPPASVEANIDTVIHRIRAAKPASGPPHWSVSPSKNGLRGRAAFQRSAIVRPSNGMRAPGRNGSPGSMRAI